MSEKEIIEQRMPVWQAISKLVLNATLSKKEIDHIVDRCRKSGYSIQELEKIYGYEVIPSINANSTMFSDLDFWVGYDDRELQSFILSYTNSKYIKDLSAHSSFIEKTKIKFFLKPIKKNWLKIIKELKSLGEPSN